MKPGFSNPSHHYEGVCDPDHLDAGARWGCEECADLLDELRQAQCSCGDGPATVYLGLDGMGLRAYACPLCAKIPLEVYMQLAYGVVGKAARDAVWVRVQKDMARPTAAVYVVTAAFAAVALAAYLFSAWAGR